MLVTASDMSNEVGVPLLVPDPAIVIEVTIATCPPDGVPSDRENAVSVLLPEQSETVTGREFAA